VYLGNSPIIRSGGIGTFLGIRPDVCFIKNEIFAALHWSRSWRAHSISIGLARIFPGTKVMVNGARARELAG
jgi:hypothetical protein